MERYRFGLGEYRYFNYPLLPVIQTIRETIYPKLAPIANTWMNALNIQEIFPETFAELQSRCWAKTSKTHYFDIKKVRFWRA